MAIKTPQVIGNLPLPPNPADRSTFNSRAYPWSEALAPWTDEANQLAQDTYDNAASAESDANSANASSELAKEWATSGSEVEAGLKSSKSYALDSAQSASESEADAALALGYKNDAYDSKNAAALSAVDANDAKSLSESARDTAQSYAEDAAESAAEAADVILGQVLDDTQVRSDRGWSSSKIMSERSVTPAADKAVASDGSGKINPNWLDNVGSGKVMREGAYGVGAFADIRGSSLGVPEVYGTGTSFGFSSAPLLGFAGNLYGSVMINGQYIDASGEAGSANILFLSAGILGYKWQVGGDWSAPVYLHHTGNTTKSPDGTLKASTVKNMSITRTGEQITKITEDGVQTNITYNADGTVNTLVYPQGGKTRTETYIYTDGLVTGMTASEV